MLPTLSCLSVRYIPERRLRHRPSSRSLRISPLHREFRAPLPSSSRAVPSALSGLGPEISRRAYPTAYAPCTPSKSEQRLPPSYYRGCWHEVSRGLFIGYIQAPCFHGSIIPQQKRFTIRRPSSFTRRRWIRVAPIVQNSSLLPPVGVWTVFQFQCGRTPSQAGYPSSPW